VGIGFVDFHVSATCFGCHAASGGSVVLLPVPAFRKRGKLYAKNMLFLLFSTKWFSR